MHTQIVVLSSGQDTHGKLSGLLGGAVVDSELAAPPDNGNSAALQDHRASVDALDKLESERELGIVYNSDTELEWALLQQAFAKYKLSLNCLFYENHQFKDGLNPNSAFFIGFNSSDLEKIEQEVCN